MTVSKPSPRFLPTLTEVVRPGHLALDEKLAPVEAPAPATVRPPTRSAVAQGHQPDIAGDKAAQLNFGHAIRWDR